MIDRSLHVALEHLHPDADGGVAPQQPFNHRHLERMRVRIVVLLADEYHVGAGEVSQHRFEIGERLPLRIVDALGPDRALAAHDLQCAASGEYYARFIEQMGGHPPSGDANAGDAQAKNDRFYLAQCAKDETMAESVADALRGATGPRTTVVHFNGAFHSDYGGGAAERTRRRLPGRRIAVISVVPVDDLDTLAPGDEDRRQADYLVYTVKNR